MRMKNEFSRAIIIVVMILLMSLQTFAYEFEVDGIYYNIIDSKKNKVEVTHKAFREESYDAINDYSADVKIPSNINLNGVTYEVTSIGWKAFENSKNLRSVDIPNSVVEIDDDAFNECTNLLYVKMSDSIKSIGKTAFYLCENLTSITIPKNVTKIGEHAFNWCKNLKEVNITDLSAWCKINFEYYQANPLCCAKILKLNGVEITDLVIPNDVKIIKPYSFPLYNALMSVTIPESIEEIGEYAFYSCYKLTNLTIAEGVKKIGEYAFCDCNSITSVLIPNTVETIGKYAFHECDGIKTIIIGNSVSQIGEYAFDGSPLNSITSLNVEPPKCMDPLVFGNYSTNTYNVLLMIPEGARTAYANADEWCKFINIQEIASVEDVELDKNVTELVRYDIYGRVLSAPAKGINIVKMSDGSTYKELVK